MTSTQEILATLSAKVERLKQKGIEPKGFLLSASDYCTLKDELKRNGGQPGNPDRLRLTSSSPPLPLYSTDEARVSTRTGDLDEPMVIL